MKKRRKLTKVLKEEAVILVLDEGYQLSEASRLLGSQANLPGRWK